MRSSGIALLLILILPVVLFGQTPHLKTAYDKESNRTQVLANTLYLVNTPEQFIQLQLGGVIWGRQPLFPAEEVVLEFYSFGSTAKYKDLKSRRLTVVLDGKELQLGTLEYQSMSGEKAGKALPTVAKVGGKLNLERLTIHLAAEQIGLLGRGTRVELRIADTAIPMDDVHMGILREFASYVMPPADVMPAPGSGVEAIEPVLPQELTGAQLEPTLKWLRPRLEEFGSGPTWLGISRLMTKSFSGCTISYKIIPAGGSPWIHEYAINLSDLDLNSIRAIKYQEFSFLYFSIRPGLAPLNRYFGMSSTPIQQLGTSLTLNPKGAPTVTAAFAQAARLCQPKP